MKSYKIILENQRSPLIEIPTPRSIFGQISWSIRELWGQDTLLKFLSELNKSPVFLLSTLSPSGYKLIPVLPFLERDSKIEIKNIKALKKSKYISREYFKEGKYNFKKALLDFKMAEDQGKESSVFLRSAFDENEQVHNSIDRNSMTSTTLFSNQTLSLKKDLKLEFDLHTDYFNEQEIKELIDYILLSGIGKKRNLGMGSFEGKIEKNSLYNPHGKGKHFYVHSSFIPSISDPTIGSYRTSSYIGCSYDGKFYPRTFLIEAGATFEGAKNEIAFGHSPFVKMGDKNILIYGYAPFETMDVLL